MDKDSKIRIPVGALRVEIDDPENRRLTKAVGAIRGWFAARDLEFPEKFVFQVGGISVPHTVIRRVDVEAAMPEYAILGFQMRYDLSSCLEYIDDNRLVINLILPGYDAYLLWFKIENSALATCLSAASDV